MSTINDLDPVDALDEGHQVRVYANALASEIRSINSTTEQVYFATRNGLVQLVKGSWERADLRGLGNAEMIDVNTERSESWLASEDKLVIKGRGRSEVTFMHVNWLPELADDLYYDFFSFVTQKEGWGTFGGNVTFISYGKFTRTGQTGEVIGTFESFDIAFTGSYGTALTSKLRGGVSAKIIYSRLSDQGAGQEQGKGTSTGFAVDLGLLYVMSSRLQWGLAVTNIGPKMAYIDAAQSDDLPRNLAFGFAYKLLQTEYTHILITAEVNKLLVGLDDGFSQELEEAILNGGVELSYNDLLAGRVGYIYDQEGAVKTMTLGIGLKLFERLKFDFSYVPSQDGLALANTLRISLGVIL
ncbi:PorV/PorQ family protein [candidate division GN15 bacterium]|nr:PorV/PorQ family protein [candidate division GN15 bacterium]